MSVDISTPLSGVPEVNEGLGAYLISTWAHAPLWTIVMQQTLRYFRTCKTDAWYIRAWIIWMAIGTTADFIVHLAGQYVVLIKDYGDTGAFGRHFHWFFAPNLVISSITGYGVQIFLLNRLYRLSKRKYLCLCIGALCCTNIIMSHTALGFSVASNNPSSSIVKFTTGWSLWGVVIADCMIAVSLVYYLRTIKTDLDSTKTLIWRLTIQAIQTGSATSAIGLVVIALFLKDSANLIGPAIFNGVIVPNFALSMLMTLNMRSSLRAGSELVYPSGSVESEMYRFEPSTTRSRRPHSSIRE